MTAQTTPRKPGQRRISWFPLTALSTATALTLALTACGGGGSSSTEGSASSGTSTYSGTVTGLGSIVVNGIRFSIAGASTQDADDPSKPYTKAFALGDSVTVTGTVDENAGTGTATSVIIHGGVRGQVTAVDTTAGTLTVDGQVVKVDTSTVWDGTTTGFSLALLATDITNSTAAYVEARGDYDAATGVLTATRVIEKDSTVVAADGVAFRGLVSQLDTTAHTFHVTIHQVDATVTYTDNTVLPSGATLANGEEVRLIVDPTANSAALTTISTATGATTTSLTASKVIVRHDRPADQTKGVIRGAIDTISTDGKTWTIGGTTVDVSQSPTLTGLTDLSTVTVGTVVMVKGTFSNGVLTAKQIISASSDDSDKPTVPSGVRLFGVVSSYTAASGSTLATFIVQGVTVTVPSTVTLPNGFGAGSYVEVAAHLVSGVLTADVIASPQSTPSTPRSFEVIGTATCPTGTSADFTGASGFTLSLRDGTATVLGAGATVTVDSHVTASTTADSTKVCVVEVTGTLTAAHTITATKIDVEARGAANTRTVSLR